MDLAVILSRNSNSLASVNMSTFRPDGSYPIEPDKLPSTWILVPLGVAIADVRPGFSNGNYNEEGNGIPHLRPMNISRLGNLVLEDVKYIMPTGMKRELRVESGDVLFNNTNSAELVGKTAAISEFAELAYSNHMTRLRPQRGLSYRFVAFQLHFLWELGYMRIRSTQHVNQASISVQTLTESVPLVIAPQEEQIRIVAEIERRFERLDRATALLTSAKTHLERFERTVIADAAGGLLVLPEADAARAAGLEYESGAALLAQIQGLTRARAEPGELANIPSLDKIFPRGESELKNSVPEKSDIGQLPDLPNGWTWAKVDQVGEVMLGRQRAPKYHLGQNMRPYLRVANVFEDYIDTRDVKQMNFSPEEAKTYGLQHNDILLNEGQSPELVGRPAMYRGEVPGACFQNTLIRFRSHPGVSPSYALLVFRSYLHSGRFRHEAKWSTNIAHLGAKRFAEMEFPLPPLVEQERIVNVAEHKLQLAEQIAELIETNLARIKHARHLVLKQAFTGILVPQLLTDTPATVWLEALRNEPRVGTTDTLQRPGKSSDTNETSSQQTRRAGNRVRRPLIEVFRDRGTDLTPEELFEGSGCGEELIDEFFEELKREVRAGRIKQTVVRTDHIVLALSKQNGGNA
jgi:type I restriction enzyme S subunit